MCESKNTQILTLYSFLLFSFLKHNIWYCVWYEVLWDYAFQIFVYLKGLRDIWIYDAAMMHNTRKNWRGDSLLSLLLSERIQEKARKCKWESVQGEDGYTTVHQSAWYACVSKHVQRFIKEKPWCCRVPAQGNKEESCYIDSEPTVVPSKLPGKLDWHGMMQAAGRQQARSRRGRMCPQQAEAWLLIDTLTATDCASRRRGGKPGWLQKGKQWKPLCTRVLWFYASRVRTSVQLVRRCVNVPQRAGVVRQLLRVHPSDLTYNSTNYLTTSITFFPPFMRTIHFSRFRCNQLKP